MGVYIFNIRAQAPEGAASAMGREAWLRIVASACLRLVDSEAAALRDFVVERHRAHGAVPFGAAGGSVRRLAAEGVNGAAEMLRSRGYGRSLLVCYAPAGSLPPPPPPPPGASAEGGGIIHVASSAI